MAAEGPWRDGRLWVLDRKCGTCIFRPGNPMHLRPGRVEGMVAECIEQDTVISCHKTLHGPKSICRGVYDVHRGDIVVLRLAVALNVIAFDELTEEH